MRKFMIGLIAATAMVMPAAAMAQRHGNGDGGNDRGGWHHGGNWGGGQRSQGPRQAPPPRAEAPRAEGPRQSREYRAPAREDGPRPAFVVRNRANADGAGAPPRRDFRPGGGTPAAVATKPDGPRSPAGFQGRRASAQYQADNGRYQGNRGQYQGNRGQYQRDRGQWDRGSARTQGRYASRPGGRVNWSHDWRNDRRYDWRNHRVRYRHIYRLSPYYAPYRNWHYRRFTIGFFLDPLFYSRSYWIGDPFYYRLPPAPPGTQWVRYYNDVLLVDVYTGEVLDVIYDFFW